jgi:hypothetical protein
LSGIDTKWRHELKYFIHPLEAVALRKRIRTLLPMDRNSVNDEGYHIRSLYFDDPVESALYDKINGVFRRKKYRIRIYNVSDRVIKLERKSKINNYVAKQSASLTREQTDRLLEGETDHLRDIAHPLIQDFYHDLSTQLLKPSVIVDYVREAYIDETSDARVTLDKELASGFHAKALFDPDLPTWSAVDGPRTILEVKYTRFFPASVYSLVQMHAHNRSTISKYVLCKERQKVYTG